MNEKLSIFKPSIIIPGVFFAILSAAICMQIMGQFGNAPNTSLISLVLLMSIAKISVTVASIFSDPEKQNYIISIASASGFVAANCAFISIAMLFVMERDDLLFPIALGTLVGSLITVFSMGKLFDTKIFPAEGSWPTGKAIATMIEAGNQGGKKSRELFQGVFVGVLSSVFGIPAAGIGIAFIANVVTMIAMAIGVILRGFSIYIFNGFDIGSSNIPQGLMIGAGSVAFFQILFSFKNKNKINNHFDINQNSAIIFIKPLLLFVLGAVITAFASGLLFYMTPFMLFIWVLFCSLAALIAMLLIGVASMNTGIAPAFAVVTIFLTVGLFVGFGAEPLSVFIGYLSSVGMPFADTGISLKAGYIIRGNGKNKEHELYGRKQQIILKYIGVFIGVIMAFVFSGVLIENNVIPPMSHFYANAVTSVLSYYVLREIVLWAIPGVILQIAFGNKSVGLMLATGLFINNSIFGVVVLFAVLIRLVIGTKHMSVRAPGLIAGDGIFGFLNNLLRLF